MIVELLIIVPNSTSFCTTKDTFFKFLSLDKLIKIDRKAKTTLTYQDDIKIELDVKSDLIKNSSDNERYFLLKFTYKTINNSLDEQEVIKLHTAIEHIKNAILVNLSSQEIVVNTLWDDIGQYFAERAYPLIYRIENRMRQLIYKFMFINVGMKWHLTETKKDISEKIENMPNKNSESTFVNSLHKLDFIQLLNVLFDPIRRLSIDEVDKILKKETLSHEDQETLKKYRAESNWEKFFLPILDDPEKFSNKQISRLWEELYSFRNDIAHTRSITHTAFREIQGRTKRLDKILTQVQEKLSEITLKPEEQQEIQKVILDKDFLNSMQKIAAIQASLQNELQKNTGQNKALVNALNLRSKIPDSVLELSRMSEEHLKNIEKTLPYFYFQNKIKIED